MGLLTGCVSCTSRPNGPSGPRREIPNVEPHTLTHGVTGVWLSAISLVLHIKVQAQYVGIDINDYRTNATKALMTSGGKSIDFILGNSLEELSKLPSNHFDLIFVDGDHSWEHIVEEFKLVEKVIARGGVIVYHDTIHLEGPRKLVEYAASFGYKNTTLNTTEGRGLSIIHR